MKRVVWSIIILSSFVGSVYTNIVYDMALIEMGNEGASIANKALGKEQENIFNFLKRSSKDIGNTLHTIEKKQQEKIKDEMSAAQEYFTQKQHAVSQSFQNIQKQAQQEVDYIFKNISLQKPAQNFLHNAVTADQYFSQGIMYTPSSHIWHNPFPIGNWLYDPISDSFLQTALISLWHGNKNEKTLSKASNNSIFTEYYPATTPYTIKGSVTVYEMQYPCFIGFMFNKARWISGSQDHVRRYRLFGLYAQDENKAGVYFADPTQQKTTKAKTPTDPLVAIVHETTKALETFDTQLFKNLASKPLVLNFEVTLFADHIAYYLWPSHHEKPQQAHTINNLNPTMYLYHGLGFMSPGARTQWHLQGPQDLLFSSQERNILLKKVSS